MASNLRAMASNLVAMASNLEAVASNLMDGVALTHVRVRNVDGLSAVAAAADDKAFMTPL